MRTWIWTVVLLSSLAACSGSGGGGGAEPDGSFGDAGHADGRAFTESSSPTDGGSITDGGSLLDAPADDVSRDGAGSDVGTRDETLDVPRLDAAPVDAASVDAVAVDAVAVDAASADVASPDAVVLDGGARSIAIPSTGTLRSESRSWRHASSVAMSSDGNVLALGDPGYGPSNQQGAVFVYERMGGRFVAVQVLLSPRASLSAFGGSVALSSDGAVLAVGDEFGGSTGTSDDGPGRVYVYTRSSGRYADSPAQTLAGPSSRSGFGRAVALSGAGDSIAIGVVRLNQVRVFARAAGAFGASPTQTLTIPSSTANFLSAVGLSSGGDTLVVGDASYGGGARRGAVHVYTRAGASFSMSPEQTIAAPSDALEFGWSVALASDGALYVGDPDYGAGRDGALLVYRRSAGAFALAASESTLGNATRDTDFGSGVAVAAASLVVGDRLGGEGGSGIAHVYARRDGVFAEPAPQTLERLWFGANFGGATAVAPDGRLVAVGDTDYAGGRGAVHVYAATAGAELSGPPRQTLRGLADSFAFGSALAWSTDGTTLVVGDRSYGATRTGAVHFFARDGAGVASTPSATIAAPSPSTSGAFGTSLALAPDGALLAVGDPNAGFMTTRPGSVRFFARVAGVFSAMSMAGLTAPADSVDFGASVAFSPDGDTLLVGDPGRGTTGAVHVYRRSSGTFGPLPTATVPGPGGSRDFGGSVAFTPDGRAALIGDPNDGADMRGSVRVFSFGPSGLASSASQNLSLDAPSAGFGASLSVRAFTAELFVGDVGYGADLGLAGAVHRFQLR